MRYLFVPFCINSFRARYNGCKYTIYPSSKPNKQTFFIYLYTFDFPLPSAKSGKEKKGGPTPGAAQKVNFINKHIYSGASLHAFFA